MYQYQIYGLSIASTRKISLLKETTFSQKANLKVDWNISTAQTPDSTFVWQPVQTELLKYFVDVDVWKTENDQGSFTKVRFKVDDSIKVNFVVDSSGQTLQMFHDEDVLESDVESLFVGPVLSFVLRLRGVVCLHSSVVALDGKAIVFPGHSTAGKSTIAAAMAEAGAKVLADDIAVLFPGEEGFLVQPGYSKVRLRPKAAAFLTSDPASLPKVYSYYKESRYASLEESGKFHPEPLPLAAVYILGEYSDDYREPFVEPINSSEKFIKLVQNTSGSYVIEGESRAKEFQILAEIAKTVPIRKLFYAHDTETLPKQCEVISEDFRKVLKHSENR